MVLLLQWMHRLCLRWVSVLLGFGPEKDVIALAGNAGRGTTEVTVGMAVSATAVMIDPSTIAMVATKEAALKVPPQWGCCHGGEYTGVCGGCNCVFTERPLRGSGKLFVRTSSGPARL